MAGRTKKLRDPWFIAAWPGMGNVALTAGIYLVEKLAGLVTTQFGDQEQFDVEHVDVKKGLITPVRPRSEFYLWQDPVGERDLIIYLADAQPGLGGYGLCRKLVDEALKRGAGRLMTFAALATPIHPTQDPRVFGVSTHKSSLKQMRELGVNIMDEGQISGLNGVLLAAAAERGLQGSCLLGEMPYFAVNVPNPKASQAVLDTFARMSGIGLDLAPLARQAKVVDKRLAELLDKMKREGGDGAEDEPSEAEMADFHDPTSNVSEVPPSEPGHDLEVKTRRRIESLFRKARGNRSKAMELKQELDRLNVFKDYEDRFLDLFKKAG
jgi:proteasome assembly chaperone (PAC2) family protein